MDIISKLREKNNIDFNKEQFDIINHLNGLLLFII